MNANNLPLGQHYAVMLVLERNDVRDIQRKHKSGFPIAIFYDVIGDSLASEHSPGGASVSDVLLRSSTRGQHLTSLIYLAPRRST